MNSQRAIRTVISAVVLLIGGQRSTANDETSGFALPTRRYWTIFPS